MSSEPLHMWSYWRDKKGTLEALEGYFPGAATEPQMAAAVIQVKNGLLLIDALMQKAADEAEDDDD